MSAQGGFGEDLNRLRHHARDCRRLAQECHSHYVALSLAELADRLDAEAALLAAKADPWRESFNTSFCVGRLR